MPELRALAILAVVYGLLAIAVLKIKIYLEVRKQRNVAAGFALPQNENT